MNESTALRPFLCATIDPSLLRSEWSRWKRAFQIFADASDISDQTKLKNKLLHFGGLEFQDVFFGIPGANVDQNDENEIKVFDIAIEKLDEYFSPKRNSLFERHLFRGMKMDKDESFDKFLIRVRLQAEKCSFGENKIESKEFNILDKIIEVAPSEIKEKLLDKEYTLQEVISIYNINTQIKSQSLQMTNSNLTSAVCTVKQNQNGNNLQKAIKCYNCNKTGHIARNCWSTSSRASLSSNGKNSGNFIQKEGHSFSEQSKTSFKCDNCGIYGHSKRNCRRNPRDWTPSAPKRQKTAGIRQITDEYGQNDEIATDEVC